MAPQVETHQFQAEARQLLQLVIHSIYSNKDIFLRELVSNASDALDKLKMATFLDKELEADISDLHIEIDVDLEQRLLTVRDNGIGMTHDEVIELIGTIARSGTAELLRKLRESRGASSPDLIGQFGVGFYSSFMVADTVTLVTRRSGTDEATRWASDGEGSYTVEAVEQAPVGTSVTLHLKPVDEEDHLFDYTAEWKIREIVKRYSDFIPWPIRMAVQRGAGDEPTTEIETINSMKALWARSRDEVSDEEYHEFYKHVSHDWTDPLETIHMRGEGTFEYEALLFLPARAPLDLFHADAKRGVQLYVKRVFIMDDCAELIPSYLRFVKGVVDAHDLSLNVSREILQRDRQIQVIRKRLVRKVLGTVKEMMTERPEQYRTFWAQFGRALKEGLLQAEAGASPDSRGETHEAILACSSFQSTHDSSALTSLNDYVSRMADGQEQIYVLVGESRAAIENSPHLEAFRAKGIEVLLLTDPVDEIWVDLGLSFDGKPFQSVARGQVDLPGSATDAEAEQRGKDFEPLLAFMTAQLAEQVKEVRLSSRLTTSPACVVIDAGDMTPALQRMLKAMGQEAPPTKAILELNPEHPLVIRLREAHAERPEDEALTGTVELLYGTAVLAEGGELSDPARFARLLAERLAATV